MIGTVPVGTPADAAPNRSGRQPGASRLAIAVSVLTALMVVVTVTLILAGPAAPLDGSWGFRGFAALLAIAFGAVGAVISLKVPGNRIGALLVAIGLASATVGFTVEYAVYGLVVHPGSLPGARAVGWVVSWAWVPFAGICTTFLPLLFPDGHVLSPRWRLALGLAALGIGLTGASLALLPGTIDNAPYLDNPLGVAAEWGAAVEAASYLGFLVLSAAMVLSAASLVIRFRQSTGVARQQMKWFAAAAVLAAVTMAGPGIVLNIVLVGNPGTSTIKVTEILAIFSLLSIPIATGIAVLRYHLFDIDRVLSRSIAWAVVTAVLVVLFVVVVLALQGLLASVTGGGTLAVAASTLLVAALAQPVARRVQSAVDQRFFRSRYDATIAIDGIAARLRAEVDLDAIEGAVVGTVGETVRPRHAAVWTRSSQR